MSKLPYVAAVVEVVVDPGVLDRARDHLLEVLRHHTDGRAGVLVQVGLALPCVHKVVTVELDPRNGRQLRRGVGLNPANQAPVKRR